MPGWTAVGIKVTRQIDVQIDCQTRTHIRTNNAKQPHDRHVDELTATKTADAQHEKM
jgi:hypothetical protein